MTRHDTPSLFESAQVEQPANRVIRVAFESGVDSEFDYLVPDKLWPLRVGQRVEAPFGRSNKLETGFCVETEISKEEHKKHYKLKTISDVVDKEPLVDATLMELSLIHI